MKRILLGALVLAIVTVSPAMRVYWIGNSVTDALKYSTWKQTAEADGRSITWGRTMLPGSPISTLWESLSGVTESPYGHWSKALKEYEWDVVSLQPYDRHLDGSRDADLPMCDEFMKYAKPKSPNVQFVLFAHYPRQENIDRSGGYQQHWDKLYTRVPGEQETRDFYQRLVEKVRALRTDMKPMVLVPVGCVYYELDKKIKAGQFPGKTGGIVAAAYSDGIHQNDFGNYIVGCTYYATMFKTNPTGFSGSRYGVSDQQAAIIQQTVWDVVRAEPLAGVGESTRLTAPLQSAPIRAAAPASTMFDLTGRTLSQVHPRSLQVFLIHKGSVIFRNYR